MIRLSVFSLPGFGTNAENIAKYFKDNSIEISAVFYNKPNAGVVDRMDVSIHSLSLFR